jgi:hypothetical protein
MALIDVNWKPGKRELRQFAAMFLVFGLAAGTAIHFFKDWHPLVSQILWGAALVLGLAGLAVPALARPVYVVMMAVALPIGFVVSTILMTLIFFLVLTPTGLVMRRFGYDPMRRRPDPEVSSYWIRRPATVDVRRYLRQY